jgi:glc operon protein GlcG
MFKLFVAMLTFMVAVSVAELPTKKRLDLATIKALVAAAEAEAEAKKLNVEVTICMADDSGNLLFLEKADGASLNTIQFAQKKVRHSALYRKPSPEAIEGWSGCVEGGESGGTRVSRFFP